MNGLDFCARAEAIPFSIPKRLREVLLENSVETGATVDVIGSELPASAVWSIVGGSGVVGHIWLNERRGALSDARLFVNFCVYVEGRSKGAASWALKFVESELRAKGVEKLYAQVNTNKPETGLRVRRWLRSKGYGLVREDISRRHEGWSDDEIVEKSSSSVILERFL